MVRGTLFNGKALMLFATGGLLLFTGCSSKSKTAGPELQSYRDALIKTQGIEAMEPGSETEKQALQRFESFYAVYSAEAVRSGVRNVYDEAAWFGDPYHTVEGIEEIESYFLLMAEPVESCTFTIDSMNRSGIDYYAHWTMTLVSSAAGKDPITAIGLSHVRFNDKGLIVFQQDYWDTSVLLDRLPVVGFWTRLVKTRVTKGLDNE